MIDPATAAQRQMEEQGVRMENRCMRALLVMYAAQQKHVLIPNRSEPTSTATFTDEQLIRAMRLHDHDIKAVAKNFNVSRGCIYNRLRELPPGAVDCSPSWSEKKRDPVESTRNVPA